MPKSNVIELIHKAMELRKEQKEQLSVFDNFQEMFCPGSYPTVFEVNKLEGFMDCLKIVDYELFDILEWFFYDSENLDKSHKYRTIQGKKVQARTDKELVDLYFAIKGK